MMMVMKMKDLNDMIKEHGKTEALEVYTLQTGEAWMNIPFTMVSFDENQPQYEMLT